MLKEDTAYLDFILQLTLEATPDNLPLTGLETVGNRRDGSNVVGIREQDELPVDEV